MSKQRRLTARDAHQPLLCPCGMASQPFVFPFGPSHEVRVDASEERVQPGLVEALLPQIGGLHMVKPDLGKMGGNATKRI